MSKYRITSLLVIPLIASAVFLANPALAKNPNRPELNQEISNTKEHRNKPDGKKNIVGVVQSINGNTIVVVTKSGAVYNVEISSATIMRDLGALDKNPVIVGLDSIKVGDTIVVRGEINNQEINAESIHSGKMFHKWHKDHKDEKSKERMLLKKHLKQL